MSQWPPWFVSGPPKAPVYEVKSYRPDHIRFGMRLAETVRRDDTGQAIADLSRISVLEPDNGVVPKS